MFQSKAYIERRHGKNGADRAVYLQQLVQEYKTTDNKEAKHQVLANLANFAYDPVNYNTLWNLKVIDLFLETLSSSDQRMLEFGLGGIANICLEPQHFAYIMSDRSYLQHIVRCLDLEYTSAVLINAMTILMQIVTEDNYASILTDDLKERLLTIKDQKDQKQACTMASLFLNDYFHLYSQHHQLQH